MRATCVNDTHETLLLVEASDTYAPSIHSRPARRASPPPTATPHAPLVGLWATETTFGRAVRGVSFGESSVLFRVVLVLSRYDTDAQNVA